MHCWGGLGSPHILNADSVGPHWSGSGCLYEVQWYPAPDAACRDLHMHPLRGGGAAALLQLELLSQNAQCVKALHAHARSAPALPLGPCCPASPHRERYTRPHRECPSAKLRSMSLPLLGCMQQRSARPLCQGPCSVAAVMKMLSQH